MFMTTNDKLNVYLPLTSLSHVGPTLQAFPAAVVFSTQLRLNPKISVAVKSESLDEKMKGIEMRANQMTPTLAQIEGWSHGGINEY
jgi:hypothetical protein